MCGRVITFKRAHKVSAKAGDLAILAMLNSTFRAVILGLSKDFAHTHHTEHVYGCCNRSNVVTDHKACSSSLVA